MTDLITEARELCKSESAEYVYMRTGDIIPKLCDALEKVQEQIESIHKTLDFAEKQRHKSKDYTELAINNGLALGQIAVTLQHDFELPSAQSKER